MRNPNSRLENFDGTSTIVPMLQRRRDTRSRGMGVRSAVLSLSILISAVISLALSAFATLLIIQNRRRLSGLIVYFWASVGVIVPLVLGIRLLQSFLNRSHSPTNSSITDSRICAVEVCIDNETVLTVRSWWPVEMHKKEVERNGIRVAMASAERWIADNAHHGGKTSKVRFSIADATSVANTHITKPSDSTHDQCSVCLDHIGPEHGLQMSVCGHVFHEDCLASWFAQSSKLSCPMCRTDHHHLVPQSVLMQYCIKEEPTVTVLTVQVEDGNMPDGANE